MEEVVAGGGGAAGTVGSIPTAMQEQVEVQVQQLVFLDHRQLMLEVEVAEVVEILMEAVVLLVACGGFGGGSFSTWN